MLIILYQFLTIIICLTLVYFKQIFSNLFWLVASLVTVAFIPNFITSAELVAGEITILQSQILFSITGSIVLSFLYYLMKDIKN